MPIFEYRCGRCESEFELFVRKDSAGATCPSCGSEELEKLFSTSAVSTKAMKLRSYYANERRHSRLRAERKRDTHDPHHDH